jgi:cyclopropane fatty-acyl-phospholipid synthase-like methyltransferase
MSGGAPIPGAITPPRVFEMMLAYKATAVLSAGIEVGIFDALADGPAGVEALAARLDLAPRGCRLLLNALGAVGLLRCDGADYHLAEGTERYLVRREPGYLGDMIKVMASRFEWDAMGSLAQAVRRGGPVVAEHAETPGYAYWEDFAAFAGAVARPTAELVADSLEQWAAGRDPLRVLDVAAGHGLYGYTFASRHPQAQVWSLDWDNVLPLAREHADQLGVGERVTMIAGDMFDAPLGGPYDLILVTNVLHHFAPDRGADLLRRLREVLEPTGRLVLVGFVTHDREPIHEAAAHLFSILMLVWTLAGEVHSEATYQRMLKESGFSAGRLHNMTSLPLTVIVAGCD